MAVLWCSIKLVEHQEGLRTKLVQSILAYVGVASFITYRDGEGFVRYAIWFEDRHLPYVLGLHAAATDLGGVEIKPSEQPRVLDECRTVWDMEMTGYGGASIPEDTGIRSATAALGTQITDVSYRLLVCHRVDRSVVIREYERSGGHPKSIYKRMASMAAREAAGFLNHTSAKTKPAKAKSPPYTHTRILLGGNSDDHLTILQDSFPAGSIRRRAAISRDTVTSLAITPPRPTHSNIVHFPVFNDKELTDLEIIPTAVTEVPMKYGRAITTTTQPPRAFDDIIFWEDDSGMPEPGARFLRGGTRSVHARGDYKASFPFGMISGGKPGFPFRIMQ